LKVIEDHRSIDASTATQKREVRNLRVKLLAALEKMAIPVKVERVNYATLASDKVN
jgi:hypothetical protein